MPVTYTDITNARAVIAGHIMRTPCMPVPALSKLTGADIFVKYENLQVTSAFKERGALVKLMSLTEDERKRGVIAMSAGNHAQAVAFHASRLNIPATIVMPETTPFVKVANTRAHGANVVLHGEVLIESQREAERLAEAQNLVWVHPYDDEKVIAGQGTIACEMLEDVPDLDMLVVPIGGGGMISGCAIAAKAMKPQIEIVGVQTELYPSMWAAMAGKTCTCDGPTIAEGIAVKVVGRATEPVVRDLVSDIILVDEASIERAINHFAIRVKAMTEGAGAAGLAAVLKQPRRFAGRKVGLVLSGGNIDPRILAAIMFRELEREEKIVSFRISINDRPGILGHITTMMGKLGANILGVSHRRMYLDRPVKAVMVDVTVETRDSGHAYQILKAMQADGMSAERVDSAGMDLM